MKKAFFIMIALFTGNVLANDTPATQALNTLKAPTIKSITALGRLAKVVKGFGTGSFSVLCASLCVFGTRNGEFNAVVDPKAGLIEKLGSIGVAAFSLVLAAELGNSSFKSFQEAVQAV